MRKIALWLAKIKFIKPIAIEKTVGILTENAKDRRKYKIYVIIMLFILALLGVISGADFIEFVK